MNVVDSSGWIEFFTDGPNARVFARPLADATSLVVPSICLLEVYRHVLRHQGRDEALRAATAMRQGRVVDLDAALALQAAETGVEHRLPLADSIVYTTALLAGATVWTQDADFKGLAGVEFRPRR